MLDAQPDAGAVLVMRRIRALRRASWRCEYRSCGGPASYELQNTARCYIHRDANDEDVSEERVDGGCWPVYGC